MKPFALPALAMVAAIGVTQTTPLYAAPASAPQKRFFRFADRSKGIVMTATDGRGDQTPQGWKVLLVGNVVGNDTKEGLELRAQRVNADIGGTAQKSLLRRAVAEGAVRMVKTVRNPAGVQTTRIDSARADYRTSTTEAIVDLAGPVTIRNINPVKRETLVASGSRGRAILSPGVRTNAPNAIRSAELTGSVKVNVQTRQGGRLVATARRMILVQGATTRTITLLDDVNISGEGEASVFSAQGQRRFVMVLNEAGEVVRWSGENG